MTANALHLSRGLDVASLRECLGAAGVLFLLLDDPEWTSARTDGDLEALLTAAPPLRDQWSRMLDAAAASPAPATSDAAPGGTVGEPVEVWPGLWGTALALRARRRIVARAIVVIPTPALLAGPHLESLCRTAGAGVDGIRSRLLTAPLPAPAEVGRLSRLAVHLIEARLDRSRAGDDVESTSRRLGESYEELSHLYTIIERMTQVERPEHFVTIACSELLATLPFGWIGMLFADDPDRLPRLADQLIVAGTPTAPEPALRVMMAGLLERLRQPMVLDPAEAAGEEEIAGGAMIAHPIASDSTKLGILVAGDKQGLDRAASSVDLKLLGATATHTAIFLENAVLYDDLNAMFLGTLEALTASIDAKDRYTCGHSQRVAHVTRQLALAAGLDEHEASRAHIAGLVHDIGKIGVPERVLLKPGRLSDEEWAWIQRHPEMSYGILKDIPQLRDILPGVLSHHERWDGAGYPSGLSGEDIPLIARLISLADAFDAMSSDRTYRCRLMRRDVLSEIAEQAGHQFDPRLAAVFLALDFSEYDRLAAEHRHMEMSASKRSAA